MHDPEGVAAGECSGGLEDEVGASVEIEIGCDYGSVVAVEDAGGNGRGEGAISVAIEDEEGGGVGIDEGGLVGDVLHQNSEVLLPIGVEVAGCDRNSAFARGTRERWNGKDLAG